MRVGLTKEEILEVTGGVLVNIGKVNWWGNFCRDSRQVKKGDFYIPLRGSRYDGHDFIEEVIRKGATGSLWAKEEIPSVPKSFTLIQVEDPLIALGKMAGRVREKWGKIVIGITGSAGKSTTKEIVWAGLSEKYNVLKNVGNYNNLIGLPLTLLRLEKEHDLIVVEMGMNMPGEISRLAKIAHPEWSIITSIAPAHIGAFGSVEEIIKEKGDILDHTKKGCVFPSGFNSLISRAEKNGFVFLSTGEKGTVKLIGYGEKITIRYGEKELVFDIRFPAMVEAEDFTKGVALALLMNEDLRSFEGGVKKNYRPLPGRMNIYTGKVTLIDDTYNANPLSVKRAVDFLSTFREGDRIFIFGDMMELGEKEEDLHRDIGDYVAEKGIEIFIVMGRRAFRAGEEAESMKVNVFYVENMIEMEQLLDIIIKSGSTILVKASRAMGFERVVNYLKKFVGEINNV